MKITTEELGSIRERHDRWRRGEPGGECADLRDADLRGMNLRNANLSDAYLRDAYLSDADLSGANLSGADLFGANLSGANLSDAYLCGANLRGANLRDANLRDTNLSDANLGDANLRDADLSGADLNGADLFGANLSGADLFGAQLSCKKLGGANLSGATLIGADLSVADLNGANLSGANLSDAKLRGADLRGANLSDADLSCADLSLAQLIGARLLNARLEGAYLHSADLRDATLTGANLEHVGLVRTNLEGATISNCRVYGISAWDVRLDGKTKQLNLIMTPEDQQSDISVDDLEVAQFIYLLINNRKIRHVIDTITSKAILILGRFTEERKRVLDALRDELRNRDYVPILFDFDKPSRRDLTETITLLASMARFIIADITDAAAVREEIQSIARDLPSVPIQPLLLAGTDEYVTIEDSKRYPWVLPTYRYASIDSLPDALAQSVIVPAEAKVIELKPTELPERRK